MTDYTLPHHQAVQQLTSPGAPFEVIERGIAGVPLKVFRNAYPNLRDYLNEGRQHKSALFLQYQHQSLSFDAFFQAVDGLTGMLAQQAHIAKGDRVAIAMRNRPEWLIAFTAIIQLGAVAVPLNSWGKGGELNQGLVDSEAKLLICDAPRLRYVRSVGSTVPTLLVDGESEDNPEYHWSEAIEGTANDGAPLDLPTIAPDDPALLLFTSGTSGRPKGALFQHQNCCQAMMNVELIGAATYMTNMDAMNQQLARGTPPKTLLAVPLFHVSGLFSQFVVNLRHGRGLYLMYKWDAKEALRLVREEGITVLMGAPVMMLELLSLPDAEASDFENIANISGGGAGTPEMLHELYLQTMKQTLAGAGWGMTETGGTGAAFTGRFMHERPGASGFPSPIVDFSFRDEDGNAVSPGAPGEIWVRSSTAISGYYSGGGEDEFVDGWFKTGDIGYINDEGLLYICGRAKDMIIRGGENVYPAEIEDCLLEFPGCAEAAVVGIHSEHWGEEVAAVVRMEPDTQAQAEDLQRHCGQHLAAFKVPVVIEMASEPLARNAVNKLLKAAIKKTYFPA